MGLFDRKVLKSYIAKYLGGHPDIKKEGTCNLFLEKDKIRIKMGFKNEIALEYKDITMEYKTEEQISKDVTLTRLLLFGVLAFGLKKKTVNKTGYIVIKFNDELLGEMQIMLEHEKAGQIVSEFLDLKRKIIA